MQSASLLVAALILLRNPCARSHRAAALLLARAAQDATLSAPEREACRDLAEALEP